MRTSDKLYKINEDISLMFLTGCMKPTIKHMEIFNEKLGIIIKEIRTLEENSDNFYNELIDDCNAPPHCINIDRLRCLKNKNVLQ